LKNIETEGGGNNNGEMHVTLTFSAGWEIRDSYFHDGYGFDSGNNYGVALLFWNGEHKIENNIFRALRHAVNFEGGGSGVAILYNFMDNGKENEDLTFLSADNNPNHGAHPYMNLVEGNSSAKLVWDFTLGSSSHSVGFRNHVRGQRTSPSFSWGQWAVDIQSWNRYISVVGNVLGMPSWTTGTVLANGDCEPAEPTAIKFGCDGQPGSYTDSQARSTAIVHGNYDYITDGVATWDGGTDHVLAKSMYYATKPAFFGSCAWPPFGPDVNGITGILPAKDRFAGGSACGAANNPPATPGNVRIIRQ
jgi:hypothetical protein